PSPEGCCRFYGRGDAADLRAFERDLRAGLRVCAVFAELPSNPLLQVPPLRALRRLADQHGFLLVVDDTIATFLNADLLSDGTADLV
ncbi:unnamed protein product, partial [Heterosigma akashiwo]